MTHKKGPNTRSALGGSASRRCLTRNVMNANGRQRCGVVPVCVCVWVISFLPLLLFLSTRVLFNPERGFRCESSSLQRSFLTSCGLFSDLSCTFSLAKSFDALHRNEKSLNIVCRSAAVAAFSVVLWNGTLRHASHVSARPHHTAQRRVHAKTGQVLKMSK